MPVVKLFHAVVNLAGRILWPEVVGGPANMETILASFAVFCIASACSHVIFLHIGFPLWKISQSSGTWRSPLGFEAAPDGADLSPFPFPLAAFPFGSGR